MEARNRKQLIIEKTNETKALKNSLRKIKIVN